MEHRYKSEIYSFSSLGYKNIHGVFVIEVNENRKPYTKSVKELREEVKIYGGFTIP